MKFFLKRFLSTVKAVRRKTGIINYATSSPSIRDDDCLIVSYPKSGNTFARFLIASYIARTSVDFYSVDSYVPDIYQVSSTFLKSLADPRIMKSHELARKDYPKVIYIYRDPKEVVMSCAFWSQRDTSDEEIQKNIDVYVLQWLARVDGFWNWRDHVEGWLNLAESKNSRQSIYFYTYDFVVKNPARFLEGVCRVMSFDIDAAAVESAVRNSSKEAMRKSEAAAKPFFSNKIRPFVRLHKKPDFDEVVSASVSLQFAESLADILKRVEEVSDRFNL